jgi:Putative zinc-finger
VTRDMTSARERGGHVQMLLGAYLLGGLSAGEASAVRAHLKRCARCRAEHDELACVPAWLSLLPAAETRLGLGLVADNRDEDQSPGVEDPAG